MELYLLSLLNLKSKKNNKTIIGFFIKLDDALDVVLKHHLLDYNGKIKNRYTIKNHIVIEKFIFKCNEKMNFQVVFSTERYDDYIYLAKKHHVIDLVIDNQIIKVLATDSVGAYFKPILFPKIIQKIACQCKVKKEGKLIHHYKIFDNRKARRFCISWWIE